MKKSNLRKIIRESIKELMTEQVQDWGPGIYRHVELYDCSNTYTQAGCDLGNIPHTGGAPNFNNLCLDITDPSGNPYLMGQVGPEIIFVEYQGQTYRILGTSAGNQTNSCSAYGLGPVESATVVNGCALQSGGNGSGSQYFDPNNPPCSSTSTPCTVYGCTDPTALNYNSTILPNCDDGGCIPGNTIFGCMDSTASNYDPTATIDDGSCITTPSCDTTPASACAVQWFQNPNANWASIWINNRDCSNYTWPSIHLETQALQIMAGAPYPQPNIYNDWNDIWSAGQNSGLSPANAFIAKMAKAKYSQCQIQACNC